MELGSLDELVPVLQNLFPNPPRKPTDNHHYIEWINTLLPDNLVLNISNTNQYRLHLSLLTEEDESLSAEALRCFMESMDLKNYTHLLSRMDLRYKSPRFYPNTYLIPTTQ